MCSKAWRGRKRVAAASSRLACRHLQAGCGAHVDCATRLRLRQAFSHASVTETGKFCQMDPILRYTLAAVMT
jgi:hypothetical protein